ncbi:MAG: hypothetical protein QXW94_07540 [Desulfurococcaceae archaeon]
MTPAETSAAVAAIAVGVYLVASSLGLVGFAVNLLAAVGLVAFGISLMALDRTRPSALWGGLLAIVGVALGAGPSASPLLVVGVVLVFLGLFALIAGRKR